MADYPTLVKTWQYNVNRKLIATGAQAADAQQLMLALVNSFIGSGFLNSWTVLQSSNNGVASAANNWVQVALAGTVTTTLNSTAITFSTPQTLPNGTALVFSGEPGVTYYLSGAVVAGTAGTLTTNYTGTAGAGQTTNATSLTWANAGTAHSWIVLKQTGVAANFQILIDLDSTNTFFATITMSPNAGFGVGTTTTAPTATDGVPLFAGPAAWGVDSGVSIQYKLHFMQSTDGACSRAVICRYSNGVAGGVVSAYIAFEVPQNPVTGWTNPCIGQWIGTSGAGQELTYTNTFNSAFVVGRGVSNMTMFLTGETATGNHALIADDYYSQNDFNGELLLMPLGLYSATAANRGRHGQLFDIWWGPGQFQALPNIQFPGAADRAFTQFGVLVVPWNGNTCQMT